MTIMVKLKGFINKIENQKTRTLITFITAEEWHLDPYASQTDRNRYFAKPPSQTLKLEIQKSILDKALSLLPHYLEFTIRRGRVVEIEKLEEPKPQEEEQEPIDIDLIMTGEPRSIRDKIKTALDTITEIGKETGMVPTDELVLNLMRKEIRPEETTRLIKILLGNGTIYEPKEGYIKKT